ncbi:MAG: DUF3800 domain-containing protein, partial [bacterium]|nr:DUF3800 domain-containing protein [bacterium]
IDEAGDSGMKLKEGSTSCFVIALVVFEDQDEADACDQRIELLKRERGWTTDSEFHFTRNSNRTRDMFFDAVRLYNFFYYGIVINKDPKRLWGPGFQNKSSFYKYACRLVFENAKDKLADAIVVIDESGTTEFKNQLAQYLRGKIGGSSRRLIKKIKQQNSRSNNLLQLADYVSGAIYRSTQTHKVEFDRFRKKISHREMFVQIWPK